MTSGFRVNGTDLYNYFQKPFTGSTNRSISDYTINGTALSLVTLGSTPTTAVGSSGFVSNALGGDLSNYVSGAVGEYLYTTPGAQTWTCPAGVTSIDILCIGGSGGVDQNRNSQLNSSWFGGSSSTPIYSGNLVICFAGGGSGTGTGAGTGEDWNLTSPVAITQYTGAVFFSGGPGNSAANLGGGGAAGYSGVGGTGSSTGTAGSGGGGGGGATNQGGGGVGVYGAGANGAAGGKGGSGGGNATGTGISGVGGNFGGGWSGSATRSGGGGALCYLNNYPVTPGGTYNVRIGAGSGISSGTSGIGGGGAVRIVWGNGRSFPSTNISTAFNQTVI